MHPSNHADRGKDGHAQQGSVERGGNVFLGIPNITLRSQVRNTQFRMEGTRHP